MDPKRPLSPHLLIYKIQITSLLSILHRATGIALFGGGFGLTTWFFAVAMGKETYETMQTLLLHPLGLFALAGLTFSFFYHLCNGIRHLAWDAGYGYDMVSVRRSGWTVVTAATVLTVLVWSLA